ncbi:MAG: nucleotidyltransferase domain-containing protein [Candidatus Hodarchaeota archaeon]
MNNLLDSSSKISMKVRTLAEEKNILLIYLFGSQIDPTETFLQRDFDIAVLVKATEENFDDSPFFRGALVGLFEQELKIAPVDLVILNSAPPILAYTIIKAGLLIYCMDNEIRISFEISAIRNYLDFKYYNDRFNEEYLESLGTNGVRK